MNLEDLMTAEDVRKWGGWRHVDELDEMGGSIPPRSTFPGMVWRPCGVGDCTTLCPTYETFREHVRLDHPGKFVSVFSDEVLVP